MIAVDYNHLAGVIVRAEAPWIRHNTHLQGRILITCGTTRCTIRAYSRRTDTVRKTIRLRYKLVPRRQQRLFEDYSGWVTYSSARSAALDVLP